jgi:hypothetical protein
LALDNIRTYTTIYDRNKLNTVIFLDLSLAYTIVCVYCSWISTHDE